VATSIEDKAAVSTRREMAAVVLLVVSGGVGYLVPYPGTFIGPLLWVAGLIWLWQSPRWSVAYKIAATVILPIALTGVIGGLLVTFASQSRSCVGYTDGPLQCVTDGPAIKWPALVFTVLWAIAATAFVVQLLRQLRRTR
jgi:hypothetical protein